jgi:hypothetical protein
MKMGLKYKICEIVKAEQANCLYLAVGKEEEEEEKEKKEKKEKRQLTIQFTNVNINAETTDRNGRKTVSEMCMDTY